ncbi:MAG TPA: UDP-N-acetylglucosamine 1-carboxyvinyltransferase [Candidatus Wallbacteria bacterium]|nr:UDP-N-acetylglucosamine 1-carboxyvinyltransferase [Candidatus Wallbacteria bacterium]
MDKFVIRGGKKLSGSVNINGAKNSTLPILAGAILSGDNVMIKNIPDLKDVRTMMDVLRSIGLRLTEDFESRELHIKPSEKLNIETPYELIKQMRASFFVLGPLLARMGKARVALPGGCAIGTRPVDIHLKGLEKLGAKIILGHGYVEASASKLVGDNVYLDFPSVGATENIMMAATLAEGKTLIENAAKEPEIDDLAAFLNTLGARIKGAGTDVIEITGVKSLGGGMHSIIPDRIEAGTFMVAAAMTGSNIKINNVRLDHLEAVIAKLQDAGVSFYKTGTTIEVAAPERLKPVNIKSFPYPGFPTDMQPQFMAAMTLAKGTSCIQETIFENRFMHVAELKRMGANVQIKDRSVIVEGVKHLSGAPVMASDLRAGAALVLAALAASGKSEILRVYHIDRGYESFEKKLAGLGADISREKDTALY